MSLTTAFRSIQAQERGKPKEVISQTDDSGKLNHKGKLRTKDASTNQFNANLGFNASETIWDFFSRHSLP